MLWMKAFDEEYGLIRRDCSLGASQYGCLMPLYVDLEEVDPSAAGAFIIDGDE